MSWLFLLAIVFLPWFSLIVSLPAMIKLKVELILPKEVSIGDELRPDVRFYSKYPIPPVTWKYRISNSYEAQSTKKKVWEQIKAEHCGRMQLELVNAYKYDFLGLFRLKLCKKCSHSILIFPKQVPVDNIPSLTKVRIPRWKPKGSGFSEDYDLREYRPGDNLRQIHWKLSAKTGKVIFREALIPIYSTPVMLISLSGSPSDLDEKLGKFYYLSKYLLSFDLPHELHCASGEGFKVYKITQETEVIETLRRLLNSPVSDDRSVPYVRAVWKYHIGGESDEA